MTLIGVGVLIIGIALLILSVFLAYTLYNLGTVLGSVNKTVEQLPDQLDGILEETGNMIGETNNTLADVNEKMKQLTPLFYVVGDVGNATRAFSASIKDATESVKTKTEEGKDAAAKNKLGGLYGVFALAYYFMKKRKDEKGETPNE